MIARLEYPGLDARPYLDQLDALGREARVRLAEASTLGCDAPPGVDPERYARVMALNDYLFDELRFVGNKTHYEDPRNSFLNEVLDRRTGIPITLALLYMEVARRAGLDVEGINFPGHFLVRCPAGRERVVRQGSHHRRVPRRRAAVGGRLPRAAPAPSGPGDPEDDERSTRAFSHATKPQILARMLLNLKRIYVQMHSFPQARDVTELLLAVDPSARDELRDRGLLAYHLKDFSGALRDLQAYLRLPVPGAAGRRRAEEHEQIWEHVKTLRRRVATLN